MADCIFCRITSGEIPTDVVYETDEIMAFRDAHPQAPVHVLIVPKLHLADALDLAAHPEVDRISGALSRAVAEVARLEKLTDKGFRLLNNCGADGGQSVHHYHLHFVGGRKLGEKLL